MCLGVSRLKSHTHAHTRAAKATVIPQPQTEPANYRNPAFLYSFLSGLTEPIGAIIGYFVLLQFFDEAIFGAIFAGVAGMMVYISINELIPTANEYAGKKLSTYGIMFGMLIMAISLVLFM